MAASVDSRVLLTGRGTRGIFVNTGPPSCAPYGKFAKNESIKQSRSGLLYSDDGKLLAWGHGQNVKIISLPDCTLVSDFVNPRASYFHFSPKGTFLATWEMYTLKDNPADSNNLHIYEVSSGNRVASFLQKKQFGWQPQWSGDETIMARNVNNELNFYEKNDFDAAAKKVMTQKVSDYKLSPGQSSCNVVYFTPGAKGQPHMVRFYKYPNVEGLSSVIASKSFFKGDRVDIKWNSKGSAALVLVSTESDKSGASYYGEQSLLLLTISGDGCIITLAKSGPIYSVEWSPSSLEFCVVYGLMPAKATLFNIKGETKFDFGTSPRNLIYYNPFGNILILAGFGNLNGHMELWNLKTKKEICRTQSRDSTHLEWCPDGEHFFTATLSPRLRIGNGYRVWHYSGSLVHEVRCGEGEELWQLHWRPLPKGTFNEKPITGAAVKSITPSTPEASKNVYRPPSARKVPGGNFKLHEYEKPSNQQQQPNDTSSKKDSRNKRRALALKAKKKAQAAMA